ncbi:MAG: hypothetical protein LBP86_12105, partial [Azoarcus sp.]|nr:hypothetical protein [Azoarcus sp.]
MTQDYIPRSDNDLLDWAEHFTAYAQANYPRWQVPAPQTPVDALAAFKAALEQAKDPNRGKVDVFKKDEARKALVKVCRGYYNAHLRFNDLVTTFDRESMGFTIPDPHRHPAPIPVTFPVLDRIDTSILRQVTIHFRDSDSHSRAKPKGVHGCEIRWAILAAPPADVEDLLYSSFDTDSPVTLAFHEQQRRHVLYFCLRWENN